MPDARTTHPTAQQLANYALGKLLAAELATVHAHVAGCAECRQKVENQPPDSFIGQLRAGIADMDASGRRRRKTNDGTLGHAPS